MLHLENIVSVLMTKNLILQNAISFPLYVDSFCLITEIKETKENNLSVESVQSQVLPR